MELSLCPYEEKTVLYNLIQLYRYDSSEYDGHVLNQHGLYLYKYLDHQWTDDYRRPFLVRVEGELAGFVLVSVGVPAAYLHLSSAEASHVISDFFIMRKFRRRGVGREVAISLFEQFPGGWEVKQTRSNQAAYAFWKHVIGTYTGEGGYNEAWIQTENWNGPVFAFQAGRQA